MQYFWQKSGWQEGDKHLKQLAANPFEREFPAISLAPESLFVLRGPRQVGKSSWLKTLLALWPDPSRAYYLSCEEIETFKELSEILKSIRDTCDLILLDEVSFIKDWERAIKSFIDGGYSGCLVVTGSHAHDLRRGADQMPGRFGSGGEIELLPMNFHEFREMRAQARWPELTLQEEFELFMKVGGFPMALIESGPKGQVPKRAQETYRKWLRGDALKLGKQEIYLRELLLELARTIGSTVSLQALARNTQISSHHTAQDYIQILEDCFALRTCYAQDPNTGNFKFRSNKKFYFIDPILYWIAYDWAEARAPENSLQKIAENVAHEEIYRKARKDKTRFGYFSSSKGEIDFVQSPNWAIEVKWQPDARGLSKAYLDCTWPQKLVWTQANILQDWPW